jgi:hypothetical protein
VRKSDLTSKSGLPPLSRSSVLWNCICSIPLNICIREAFWKDVIACLHEVAEISYCNMIDCLQLDAYRDCIIFIRIM